MDNLKKKPEPIKKILNSGDIGKIAEGESNTGLFNNKGRINPTIKKILLIIGYGTLIYFPLQVFINQCSGQGIDDYLKNTNLNPPIECNNQPVPSDYKNLQNSYQ